MGVILYLIKNWMWIFFFLYFSGIQNGKGKQMSYFLLIDTTLSVYKYIVIYNVVYKYMYVSIYLYLWNDKIKNHSQNWLTKISYCCKILGWHTYIYAHERNWEHHFIFQYMSIFRLCVWEMECISIYISLYK